MAGRYLKTAKKLQTACRRSFGVKLLINEKQWYSEEKDMAMTMYSVCEVLSVKARKTSAVEIFRTYSQVQLVLFMRDYWYELNGWEVPHDNEKWEEIKAKYGRTKEPSNKAPGVEQGSDRRYSLDTYGADVFK